MFIAPEVIRSVLFQMSLAKEKASEIIPGEIRQTFSDGDDVIIVNSNSGSFKSLRKRFGPAVQQKTFLLFSKLIQQFVIFNVMYLYSKSHRQNFVLCSSGEIVNCVWC